MKSIIVWIINSGFYPLIYNDELQSFAKITCNSSLQESTVSENMHLSLLIQKYGFDYCINYQFPFDFSSM
ncbi:hypothetical protein [Chryseobacterium potabilaquae]|uniref:hypothetical protein n=1 Tax=Chryseobacterium potabilaquae TaxID=2675057 RepID=UPI00138A48A7|nr:hypothetical protein [Chryseobacterium potabilaquae]